jgi:pyruvate kinase
MKRRTKIVCTIGPASSDPKTLRAMMRAGMDVARLNFSHDTHAGHRRTARRVRAAAEHAGRPLAILTDLAGPKLRIGDVDDGTILVTGRQVEITTQPVLGDAARISLPAPDVVRALRPGHHLYIDDGNISLRVIEASGDQALCKIVVGGPLSSHKGVSVPDTPVELEAVTDKDLNDLACALDIGADWVAASFVSCAHDAERLRDAMRRIGREVPLIAKVERRAAVANIDEIVDAFDGVMVARGDLGVEVPIESVPSIQKDLIARCATRARVVITATQMLESMTVHTRPTRAEVTDVANAIFDGTDAIMLSGETAVGKYPVKAVQMMARIARRAERDIDFASEFYERREAQTHTVTDAIASGTVEIACDLGAQAIITFTSSGHTARAISKLRPAAMIIGVTFNREVARRLALCWGVQPILVRRVKNTDAMLRAAADAAAEAGYVKRGDQVVITAGLPIEVPGTTNLIKVETV